jgi:hypothetical protein
MYRHFGLILVKFVQKYYFFCVFQNFFVLCALFSAFVKKYVINNDKIKSIKNEKVSIERLDFMRERMRSRTGGSSVDDHCR